MLVTVKEYSIPAFPPGAGQRERGCAGAAFVNCRKIAIALIDPRRGAKVNECKRLP